MFLILEFFKVFHRNWWGDWKCNPHNPKPLMHHMGKVKLCHVSSHIDAEFLSTTVYPKSVVNHLLDWRSLWKTSPVTNECIELAPGGLVWSAPLKALLLPLYPCLAGVPGVKSEDNVDVQNSEMRDHKQATGEKFIPALGRRYLYSSSRQHLFTDFKN